LSRPSTPPRLKDESDIASAGSKGLYEQNPPSVQLAYGHFDTHNTWIAGSSPAMRPLEALQVLSSYSELTSPTVLKAIATARLDAAPNAE